MHSIIRVLENKPSHFSFTVPAMFSACTIPTKLWASAGFATVYALVTMAVVCLYLHSGTMVIKAEQHKATKICTGLFYVVLLVVIFAIFLNLLVFGHISL